MNDRERQSIAAPILALDLGHKRVGAAVSDKLSISITRLKPILRTSWKRLLHEVESLIQSFDAQTLVIGLPLRLNGSTGDAALEVRSIAEKFARSLAVPVYLQDECLSTKAAEENLRAAGEAPADLAELVDSEAAAIILRDFLSADQDRLLVTGKLGSRS